MLSLPTILLMEWREIPLGYWKFFPAVDNEENTWGCIPMWGFGEVIESNCDDITNGERLFGYFPAADYLTLSPIKVSNHNFTDGKEASQGTASRLQQLCQTRWGARL